MKKEMHSNDKLINPIGLGTWQLGAKWGEEFDYDEAYDTLQTALDNGINFIDTADIYNDGNSEKVIGDFMKNHENDFYVVTKCGRQLDPHIASGYTPEAIEKFIKESKKRLQVDKLDMILLHCPPTEVYDNEALFNYLKQLKNDGVIKGYGVSIEKVEEGIKAIKHGVDAIEVIFNMFRLKPAEELFNLAMENNVDIIVRVPLASGLLTGKFDKNTKFGEKDHRNFNRNGEAFDKGETFSGVDYETGLQAVDELKEIFQTDNLAPIALKWILMHDAVTAVIPGASKKEHVLRNLEVDKIDDLTKEQMDAVEKIYNKYFRDQIHQLW